jgi:hypothetical protein
VRRAAQLGVVSPNVYQARLLEAGYSTDDIALEVDLLLTEIADVQAQRARREASGAAATERGLSLAQLEHAVKLHEATIDAYRARAFALGYVDADVSLLARVLERELATERDAEARRTTIDGELATRQLSLAQLEDAVKQGFKTVDAFQRELQALGYGADDAELLVALLLTKLGAAA